jgi:hypothetical protein
MEGYDLTTQHIVTRVAPYVHYEDAYVEIRSAHSVEEILNVDISPTILPGNLSAFIYPADAIIIIKETNTKLKDLFKRYDSEAIAKNTSLSIGLIYVPPKEEDEEEDVVESEDECEGEEDEDEDDAWEQEDDEDINEAESENELDED